MCGISGFISSEHNLEKNVTNTLKLMSSRGPDYQNCIKFNVKKKQINLLHSRLSIIDLQKRSNQPFKIGNYTIIFNGEIYNYLEVRENLKKKNYKFKTDSDTEVLLNCYIEYKEDCFNYLNGMWSFAIWNDNDNTLFLSRDSFGEKPLYYSFEGEDFFFGSEIKYLFSLSNSKKFLNDDKMSHYLFDGYKSIYSDDKTFYKNIFSLPHGSYLKINLDNNYKIKKYYKPIIDSSKSKEFNLMESIKKNKDYLIKSVDLRMRSDVPLAFCLSGGIDSGSIVSIASKVLGKKVDCFSIIDDDEKYNEYNNITKIVKDCGVKHYPIFLKDKKNDFFSKIEKLIDYHDSPISTISYFIHSYLLEDISSKKFKVSISGTGADEMYTGYYDHFLQYFASVDQNSEIYKNNLKFWEEYIKPSLRNPALINKNFYKENPKSMSNVFEQNFELKNFSKIKKSYSSIKEKNFTESVLRNRMLNEMFHEIVPVILKHDDHNAMMNSVENRSPFLDKELLNFTCQIPAEYLIQNGFQKFILRESMKDILIDSVRLDRKKRGFNASINSLIDFKDSKNIDIIFSKKNIINEFVDLEKLKRSINFSKIPNHLSKFLFSIINCEIFLKKNF